MSVKDVPTPAKVHVANGRYFVGIIDALSKNRVRYNTLRASRYIVSLRNYHGGGCQCPTNVTTTSTRHRPCCMSPALRRCLLPPSRPTGKVALDLFLIRRANEHRPIVTMTSKRSLVLCSLVAIVSIAVANSFHILIMRGSKQQSCLIPRSNTRLYVETRGKANGRTKFGQSTNVDDRFLSDFKTADGSSVDPYKMLQVSRSATSAEIKQSYRRLSRKLHPDMVAQSDVLPGRW